MLRPPVDDVQRAIGERRSWMLLERSWDVARQCRQDLDVRQERAIDGRYRVRWYRAEDEVDSELADPGSHRVDAAVLVLDELGLEPLEARQLLPQPASEVRLFENEDRIVDDDRVVVVQAEQPAAGHAHRVEELDAVPRQLLQRADVLEDVGGVLRAVVAE